MKIHGTVLLSIILGVLVKTSLGQKFSPGNCATPLVSVAAPVLTIANLAGTWREYARTPTAERIGWKCATYSITVVTANTQFTLQIGAQKKLTGLLLRSGGTITVGGSTGAMATAQTFLTITVPTGVVTKSLNYFIIALDAASPTFLGLYACENVAFGKVETVLLLVKDTVTVNGLRTALTALSAAGFPATTLKFNYQSKCAGI